MGVLSDPLTRLLLGAALAFAAAFGSYCFKLLTRSGALAAFVLGFVVFGLGGWQWALVLIAFFVSSSFWSLVFRKKKKAAEQMYAKGGRRDAGQVLANGGLAGSFVLLQFFLPDSALCWLGFCAALAAANADTWATELGVLNRRKPLLITNGKAVEPGTSGAISLVGTLASAAGAAFIAILGCLLHPTGIETGSALACLLILLLAGMFGSLVDSALGATLQAIYYCSNCQKETEKHPLHDCGSETRLLRGKKWMTNDLVNFCCTLSASAFTLAFLFSLQLFRP